MSHTDSMDRMYRKHSQMIYAFLLSRTGEAALAEELTQETFYQAVKSLNSFKGQSSASTWLCGIANNVWLSHLRKQKRSGEIFSSDEDEACFASSSAESPEDKFIRKADNLTLMQALHEIKEPMREVLYLRLMGELSFREIGQIMGQSENWARVTFFRGKKKLIEGVKIDE
ncbi:MAG: sigma-70 family RNA polymerase sigma factor [Firmicutes bacterium]|nr:sigma-70 family RNA polymerase sigma factor [Bacillota bacterium]